MKSKLVILHHAHHVDEGVYRMIYCVQEEHEVEVTKPNPKFVPHEADELPKLLVREDGTTRAVKVPKAKKIGEPEFIHTTEIVTVQSEHQDIIWDAEDGRWLGMIPKDVAAEQTKDVKKAIANRKRAATNAAKKEAEKRVRPLGTEGQEL